MHRRALWLNSKAWTGAATASTKEREKTATAQGVVESAALARPSLQTHSTESHTRRLASLVWFPPATLPVTCFMHHNLILCPDPHASHVSSLSHLSCHVSSFTPTTKHFSPLDPFPLAVLPLSFSFSLSGAFDLALALPLAPLPPALSIAALDSSPVSIGFSEGGGQKAFKYKRWFGEIEEVPARGAYMYCIHFAFEKKRLKVMIKWKVLYVQALVAKHSTLGRCTKRIKAQPRRNGSGSHLISSGTGCQRRPCCPLWSELLRPPPRPALSGAATTKGAPASIETRRGLLRR